MLILLLEIKLEFFIIYYYKIDRYIKTINQNLKYYL